VPVLPSTAFAAALPAVTDEAVAVLPCEIRVGAACADPAAIATISPLMSATTSVTTRDVIRGLRARKGGAC
jgi:hypothetical protein